MGIGILSLQRIYLGEVIGMKMDAVSTTAAIAILKDKLGLSMELAELERAFLHSSFIGEHSECGKSNERLEFLGDAVIELAVREHLFERFPEENEGALTQRKAARVSDVQLARHAQALGLDQCVFLGKGAEETGGRATTSILAGAFEALAGVVFLCEGYPRAKRFVCEHLSLDRNSAD